MPNKTTMRGSQGFGMGMALQPGTSPTPEWKFEDDNDWAFVNDNDWEWEDE